MPVPTQMQLLDVRPPESSSPPAVRPRGLPLASIRPEVMTAARYLGVSRWTIQRLLASGELEGYHVRAAAMVTLDSLDAYLERSRDRRGDGG